MMNGSKIFITNGYVADVFVVFAMSDKSKGKRYTKLATMAKLFTSEHAMKTTTKVVQLFSGYGYIKDYPVERMMRDAKITEIYEGTSEVQRIVISANMGL